MIKDRQGRILCERESSLERAFGTTYKVWWCPRVCEAAARAGEIDCPLLRPSEDIIIIEEEISEP